MGLYSPFLFPPAPLRRLCICAGRLLRGWEAATHVCMCVGACVSVCVSVCIWVKGERARPLLNVGSDLDCPNIFYSPAGIMNEVWDGG